MQVFYHDMMFPRNWRQLYDSLAAEVPDGDMLGTQCKKGRMANHPALFLN